MQQAEELGGFNAQQVLADISASKGCAPTDSQLYHVAECTMSASYRHEEQQTILAGIKGYLLMFYAN